MYLYVAALRRLDRAILKYKAEGGHRKGTRDNDDMT